MDNGTGTPVYLQSLTYDLFGRPRVVTHGNGTVDTRTYEPGADKNFRLKQIKAVSGSTTEFQYDYSNYDANARLTELDDTTATPNPSYPASLNASATYTYDGLGRVLQVNFTQIGAHRYCYDTWDNLRCKDGTTATCTTGSVTCTAGTAITYNSAKPHEPLSATGALPATFQHDANGNRSANTVGIGPYTYAYDLDDRLRLLQSGSEGLEFMYDYTGRRTKKLHGPVVSDHVQPDETTYHYTDFLEVTGTTERKEYFAGDLLIASREITAPSSLQVAGLGGDGAVQVASLLDSGGPALILRLRPDAARGVAVALVLAGGLLLCLPQRRRPAVVGIRIGAGGAIALAVVLTVGTLPWPLLIRPAYAKGGPPPTPTPVPSAQIHHYHLDHLNSPQLVTDGGGAVVQQLRYLPYGEVRNGSFAEQDDRLFTGYQAEDLSDLGGGGASATLPLIYNAGARFYDAEFALFLTHDPARQFASPYTYTNWNPIGRSDPNGAEDDVFASDDLSSLLAADAAISTADTNAASTTTTTDQTGAVGSANSEPAPQVGNSTLIIQHTTINGEAALSFHPADGTESSGLNTADGGNGSSDGLGQLTQGANAVVAQGPATQGQPFAVGTDAFEGNASRPEREPIVVANAATRPGDVECELEGGCIIRGGGGGGGGLGGAVPMRESTGSPDGPGIGGSGFRGNKGFELQNAPHQPVRNAPGEVNGQGYSGHAFDEMQNRGVMPSVVDNAIQNGTTFPTRPGTTGYYDAVNNVRVIVNSNTGQVVTVIRGAP